MKKKKKTTSSKCPECGFKLYRNARIVGDEKTGLLITEEEEVKDDE